MQESRNYNVFFGVFLGGFFRVWKREKNVEMGRTEILEKCLSSLSGNSPRHENQGVGHCKAAGLNPPLIRLILTPLNRY